MIGAIDKVIHVWIGRLYLILQACFKVIVSKQRIPYKKILDTCSSYMCSFIPASTHHPYITLDLCYNDTSLFPQNFRLESVVKSHLPLTICSRHHPKCPSRDAWGAISVHHVQDR